MTDTCRPTPLVANTDCWPASTIVSLRERYDAPRIVDCARDLNHLAAARLCAALTSARMLVPGHRWSSVEELASSLTTIPSLVPLARASLHVLERHGYLHGDLSMPDDGTCHAATDAMIDIPALAASFASDYPEYTAHASLTALCVGHIPAVLRGERASTEVFFGDGMTYMEAVFRDNPNADFHNALCAAFVANWVPRRLARTAPQEPLAILEVGAGTGGTTSALLPVLDPYGGRLTYAYTDISVRFRRIGRKQFSEGRPWLGFGLFDIERDAPQQGYALASLDLIVAANVVHASRDIGRVLHGLRQLLKPGGVLLLNEMTALMSYTTVTFGMLGGWWAFEDAKRRIPFTPLLSPEGWTYALLEAGFDDIAIADGGTPGCAQSVIVATRR